MGSVIHLSQGRSRRRTAPPRSQAAGGKVALVLGGGGITGAAYQLGVLSAMNAANARATVNDFDIYVGTSAGAVVAACLANGISPQDLVLANLDRPGAPFPGIGANEVMLPDKTGLARSLLRWPLGMLGALRRYIGHPLTTGMIDGLGALAEGLPSALYSTDGTERYLRSLLSEPGRSNDFRKTKAKLLIPATDIDTAQRVVFGEKSRDDIAISEAAAASTSIPLLYAPRRIDGREYLDGGLRSTVNIDVAIAHGATLVVCVNPLVPYVHDVTQLLPTATGLPAHHLGQKGFPHVAAQAFRIMAQSQMEKELEVISHAHPEVDMILIEPRQDDDHLFVFNLMDYASRERISRHAFESVAIDLVTRFPEYSKVFGRHGIRLERDHLVDQLQSIVEGGQPLLLEARSPVKPGRATAPSRRRS